MSSNRAEGYLRRLLPADTNGPMFSNNAVTTSSRDLALDYAHTPLGPSWTIQYADRVTAETLRVRPTEQDFLARLTAILRTPRAVKKLANLYHLLRLSVPENALDEFIGDDATGGPYQAAALLLSTLIAEPHDTRALLELLANATAGSDICEVLTATGLPTRLAEFITALRQDIPVHGEVVDYQRCATMVARYGFETYDLFTARPQQSPTDSDASGIQGRSSTWS